MKTVSIIVPRMLIKHHLPHPEDYGESLVELRNTMITDVYTDEDGALRTQTNNPKLIKYVTQNDVKEPNYVLQKQRIQLRTVESSDVELCLQWLNQPIKEDGFAYSREDVRLYISHAMTYYGHLFVVKQGDMLIGLAGFNIINQTGVLTLKLFVHDGVSYMDEDSVLRLLINHVKEVHGVREFKAFVPKNDDRIKQIYQRHGFVREEVDVEKRIEHVYTLTSSMLTMSETEKAILNEFLELYPKKLYDLANPDELVDLEHAIDYSLKVYARLILSKQLDQRDEFSDIFVNDDGCLSIESNLIIKYDAMMKRLFGQDLRIAKEYKDLIIVVLEIINRRIKHYRSLETYRLDN